MQTFGQFRPNGFDARGLGSAGREDWLVVGVSRTRDSGPLAESNFACTVREIRKAAQADEDEAGDWSIERFGHWGPGWFEIIVVRPGTEAARVAQEISDALEDYPVVDEDDFSEREWEAACDAWEHSSLRGRVELLQDARQCIFAARRHEFPNDPQGAIRDRLVRE